MDRYIRRDGISDWILRECKQRYGNKVTKEDIFYYVFTHLEANATLALYRTMNLEQLLTLIVCLALSIPLYFVTTRYTSKLVEKLLFSTREYNDE